MACQNNELQSFFHIEMIRFYSHSLCCVTAYTHSPETCPFLWCTWLCMACQGLVLKHSGFQSEEVALSLKFDITSLLWCMSSTVSLKFWCDLRDHGKYMLSALMLNDSWANPSQTLSTWEVSLTDQLQSMLNISLNNPN